MDEKSKSGNCSTSWAQFYGVALKLRQGTYQIPYMWHQTWLTFEVNSEYILLVFALHTHRFDFFRCPIYSFWPGIAVYEAEERSQASHTFRGLQSPWRNKFPAKDRQVKSWPWELLWVISYNVTKELNLTGNPNRSQPKQITHWVGECNRNYCLVNKHFTMFDRTQSCLIVFDKFEGHQTFHQKP